MANSSNSCLSDSDLVKFAAICRRNGCSPGQFRISHEVVGFYNEACTFAIREIAVEHAVCSCRRRYRVDFFSDWLGTFENDLRYGLLDGWADYEWA